MSIIRIFPNSSTESETRDELCTWLLTALKARNGEYLLPNPKWLTGMDAGSIVLFRFGLHEIVGEAVVVRTAIDDSDKEYPARVLFSPSSIRLYVPYLPVAALQDMIGGISEKNISVAANAYALVDDWSVYGKILGYVAARGHFFG